MADGTALERASTVVHGDRSELRLEASGGFDIPLECVRRRYRVRCKLLFEDCDLASSRLYRGMSGREAEPGAFQLRFGRP